MALLSTITCIVCGKRKSVCHSASDYPDTCGECEGKERNAKRNAHLLSMKALSLEQRIARIEGILYDDSQRPEPYREMRIG